LRKERCREAGIFGWRSHLKKLRHVRQGGSQMSRAFAFFKHLKKDEEGAALIEYTALLAILLVAIIGIIGAVGNYILNTWTSLNTALA
jgi:pilus assembly protein Flp/PilA